MDALCKPRFFATRIGAAFGRALHSRQPLSTASSAHAVHTVGKAGRNSNIFTGLPAFHFASVQFSKTGRVFIHAIRLVSGLLSTFPASTVTTTNKEYIFKAFYSSRDLCRPPEFLWSWLALCKLHAAFLNESRTRGRVLWGVQEILVLSFLFQTGNPQEQRA
jgi:hypothetical protein